MIYPEIQKLDQLYKAHKISIDWIKDDSPLEKVQLTARGRRYHLRVEDEYGDLTLNSPLLHFYLILRELEIYGDSEDFLQWCKWQNVDASNEALRVYYQELDKTYQSLNQLFGGIDSCISSMDYELNSGPFRFCASRLNEPRLHPYANV